MWIIIRNIVYFRRCWESNFCRNFYLKIDTVIYLRFGKSEKFVKMGNDSTYCFKGPENFHIENGILRGYKVPYLSKHTSYGELILERLKSHPEFVGQIDGATGREETFAMMFRDYRIVPSKIEQVLQMHPGVKENVVVGIPDDLEGEVSVAFVAKNCNTNVTKDELQKLVADALPDHMKLRGGVIFLDQLPHTPSGNKVGRTQLKQLAKSYAR